ncbi:hypothetical protein [Parvularcula sp. LCG005]|uniref:hypothetical protein n=1 Tax=Parvularcula sp. LCG005 TaxID=3078805 RepID=UPI002942C035|nr:hypothetical protein [Parvularcula sp. LCG005]WOI51983.1 hypothetical protein RUI03_07415 [Parvularcula sp. LCG005]
MMRPDLKRLSAMAAVLCVSACTGVNLVPPGTYVPNKDYQLTMGKAWTAYPVNRRTQTRTLTIDGTMLNELLLASSIKDGATLIELPYGDRERLAPTFRADMGEFEIAEFVADSLIFAGMANVETYDLRPADFGTLSGVRFDFTGAHTSGLEYSGTAKAAVEEGALHLILFYAPTEYYFGLHADEVENIMASVTLR